MKLLARRPLLGALLAGWAGVPRAALLTQPREADWARLPPHPRLFVDEATLTRVAAQQDAGSQRMRRLIHAEAERLAAGPPNTYPTQGLLTGAVRESQRRVLTWGMAGRLQRDDRLLQLAKAELLALARRDDWGGGHFLTVGEAALAVAVGYDWLHGRLTEAERTELRAALVARALLPSFEHSPGEGSWVNGDFNWAQVCHGGLVAAALAIAEQEPALARAIVARALSHLGPVTAAYAPDGANAEGPSYWSYGTMFHLLLVEALRGCLGQAFGLDRAPGFHATADYALQMRGPSDTDFNYSDFHDDRAHEPVMAWFARERGDAGLMAKELADLARLGPGKPPSRHLPLELAWFAPDLPAAPGERPRHWVAGGTQPLGVLRSAWNDPRASFIAAKGGTAKHSHAHMDAGSFVLEADGVRWALDLGTESYDRMRKAGVDLWNYRQDSSRWLTFRVGPEGHNILRFDGGPQRVDGFATVARLPERQGTLGHRFDLGSLYAGAVTAAQRDILLHADRTIEITDRWIVAARPVQAQWQWLTRAAVTVDAGGLLLQQEGRRLRLAVTITGAAGWTAEVQDVSVPRAPQDSPNPGLRRIVLKLPSPPGASVTLRVIAQPGG